MRKRDVVIIGGVLAVVIATAVVLISAFSDSAKESDGPAPGMVQVLVPTKDVQAGQAMDALIEAGHLKLFAVPLDTLVEGAATDVSQIEGKAANRPIEKDEQISLEYLS